MPINHLQDLQDILSKDYNILKEISSTGKMRHIFLADYKKGKKEEEQRIIKVLKLPEEIEDSKLKEKLENVRAVADREWNALEKLVHQNIVRVWDSNFDGLTKMIIEEYLEGGSLKQYIDDNCKLLPLSNRIKPFETIFSGIISGLNHLHSKGYIHRDIKPGNILLSKDLKQIKIDDLQTAVLAEEKGTHKCNLYTRCLHGENYIAPELLNDNLASFASDIYSLGLSMYEFLVGTLDPLKLEESRKDQKKYSKNLRKTLENLPRKYQAMISKCLEYQPEKRYQNAQELNQDWPCSKSQRIKSNFKRNWIYYAPSAILSTLALGLSSYLYTVDKIDYFNDTIVLMDSAIVDRDLTRARSLSQEIDVNFFDSSLSFLFVDAERKNHSNALKQKIIEQERINKVEKIIDHLIEKDSEIGKTAQVFIDEQFKYIPQPKSSSKKLPIFNKALLTSVESGKYYRFDELFLGGMEIAENLPEQDKNSFLANLHHKNGMRHVYAKDYASALTAFSTALTLSDEGLKPWVQQETSNIYRLLGDYEKAKKILNQQQSNPGHLGAWAKQKLGWIALRQNHIAEANTFLDKGLEDFNRLNDEMGKAWTLHEKCVLLTSTNKLAEAKDTCETTLESFSKLNSLEGMIWTNYRLGLLDIKTGNYLSARKRFEESLKYEESIKLIPAIALINFQIGRTYFLERNFSKALHSFEKSIHWASCQDERDIGGFYPIWRHVTLGDARFRSTNNFRDGILLFHSNYIFLNETSKNIKGGIQDYSRYVDLSKQILDNFRYEIGQRKYNLFTEENQRIEW